MYCEKCGKEIEASSAFCEYCGAKVNSQPSKEENATNEKKQDSSNGFKKKINKKIIIIPLIVVALIAIGVGVFNYFNNNKTINLNNYASVKVRGFNGVGVAEFEFDKDKFRKDYGNYIKEKVEENGEKSAKSFLKNLFGDDEKDAVDEVCSDLINGELSKSEGLKNGDTIIYKWDVKEEMAEKLGLKFDYDDIKEEVSGLKVVETFDPFENISIKYEGVSPDAEAEIENGNENTDDSIDSVLSFSLDKSYGLKNGDVITISILGENDEIAEMCYDEYKKIPKYYSKKVKVSGLSELITDEKGLSDDVIKKVTEQSRKIFKDTQLEAGEETLMDMSYVDGKLEVDNENDDISNFAQFIFKTKVKVKEGKVFTFYTYATCNALCTDGSNTGLAFYGDNITYDVKEYTYQYTGYKKIEDAKANFES